MALSSQELIEQCQLRGLLSKEAARRVSYRRERMIKKAIAGLSLSMLRGKVAPKKPGLIKGMLERFGKGGLTGSGNDSSWSDVAANMTKMMALAGMTAGATAGVQGIMRHSKDKKLRGEIEDSYKNLYTEHEELREFPRDQVRKHFNVLARYAPSMAADPLVAGSWVKEKVQTKYIEPADIKTLAEAQRRIDESREGKPIAMDRGAVSMVTKAMSPGGGKP
jgi:hypothetical protein